MVEMLGFEILSCLYNQVSLESRAGTDTARRRDIPVGANLRSFRIDRNHCRCIMSFRLYTRCWRDWITVDVRGFSNWTDRINSTFTNIQGVTIKIPSTANTHVLVVGNINRTGCMIAVSVRSSGRSNSPWTLPQGTSHSGELED